MSTAMTPEAAVVHPSRAKIVEILAKAPAGATAFEIAALMGRTTTWCARTCQ